jgi:rhamnosyltransferase
MAHFDPDGQLAPHARRFVDQLATVCDRVILVTTSGLGRDGERWAATRPHVEVVQRPNVGHDFMSYRYGLEVAHVESGHEVVLCNDSFVGTTVPLLRIWKRMQRRRCGFWGLTSNTEIAPHVQSYFMVFRHEAAGSEAFRSFWEGVTVLPDKKQVIHSYEVGLSRRLLEAGFECAAYFRPGLRDTWMALNRVAWRARPDTVAGGRARLLTVAREMRGVRRDRWNPTIVLADRVLGGRLPVAKLQVFREDPARLGAASLLARCEQRHPELFEGVRAYLERTAPAYTTGLTEHAPPASHAALYRRVRY